MKRRNFIQTLCCIPAVPFVPLDYIPEATAPVILKYKAIVGGRTNKGMMLVAEMIRRYGGKPVFKTYGDFIDIEIGEEGHLS